MTSRLAVALLTAACLLTAAQADDAAAYDPLVALVEGPPTESRLVVDPTEGARQIPIRVLVPAVEGPCPVLLFSHGLGGTCEGNDHLAFWAARGYVVVYLQHPGSDDSVWKGVPAADRLAAMRRAASAANFSLRVADVRAVLDRLTLWQNEAGHPLAGHLELARIGMSGHSFGAVTTQAVSGQRFGALTFTDPRIRAALAFSPSPPEQGDVANAFAAVAIPWLLMTGTDDTSLIGRANAADRQKVYQALPVGSAYELVFDKAEHSAFTDRALPGDRQPRNPNHHRALQAISTAFWDAYLREDPAAKAWLDGDGPRSVLEPADAWQHK